MNGGAVAVGASVRAAVLAVAFFLAGSSPEASAATRIRITGDRVNLRAAPGAGSEVVAQCSRGDVLTALESRGEWVQVAAPDSADAWVFEELIENGVVAAAKTQVRAGPGINYPVLCTVEKGTALAVRGSRVGWLQVAPPAGCRLWVSAQFTESADKPVAAPVPPPPPPLVAAQPRQAPLPATPPPAAPPVRVAPRPQQPTLPPPAAPAARPTPPAKPATPPSAVVEVTPPPPIGPPPTPPQPASRHGVLRPPERPPRAQEAPPKVMQPALGDAAAAPVAPSLAATQGSLAIRSGILSPAAWVWHRPAKYRLVREDQHGYAVTICYVGGDESRLAPLVGERLTVHGREKMIQGVRHPLLVPERIEREAR